MAQSPEVSTNKLLLFDVDESKSSNKSREPVFSFFETSPRKSDSSWLSEKRIEEKKKLQRKSSSPKIIVEDPKVASFKSLAERQKSLRNILQAKIGEQHKKLKLQNKESSVKKS